MAHVTQNVRFRGLSERLALTGLALSLGGCTFYARSPDQYRDDTSNLLAMKQADLNACYDNVLKSDPQVAGKVTVRFIVEKKTGKITNVAADAARTNAPQPLIDCVVTAINGLMLNPADQRNGDGTFEYDFARSVKPPPPPIPKP